MVNKHCCYGECNSDSRYSDKDYMHGIAWIPFPKPLSSKEKCLRWIRACGRGKDDFNVSKINKDVYICTKHFVGGKGPTTDHPDPIPATYTESQVRSFSRKRKAPMDRRPVLQENKKPKEAADAEVPQDPCELYCEVGVSATPQTSDMATQTDLSKGEIARKIELTSLKNEVILLQNEVAMLKSQLQKNANSMPGNGAKDAQNKKGKQEEKFFDVNDVEDDDDKCKFYTGLTFVQFMCLWSFLGAAAEKLTYWNRPMKDNEKSPSKRSGLRRKMQPMTQLLLTLVRLRVGLLHKDLAYRFGVSVGQVSTILLTWIQFMYKRFSNLKPVMFPSRSVIKQHLPKSFRGFRNIRVVIDCTEIFVQQATDFGKQGNLYSSYKGHATFKLLVGISPNGSIMFVSDAFEGSISDRSIVEQSGFLDYLEEGDLVLADRGFTIEDLLQKKKAKLNIPPFLAGRKKLTAQEEAETKTIAKVRIHVERAIERMKKFRLLKHVIPLSLTPVFSQMTFVIGCLVNFQEPLVK